MGCPDLPTGTVGVKVKHPGSNSHFDVTLIKVHSGYIVTNGEYVGWCADSNVSIISGPYYDMTLYCSLDASIPDYLHDTEKWHEINYILNHKHPNASWQDIQTAIWFFSDYEPDYKYGEPSTRPKAQDMINDAQEYGGSYMSQAGEILAIICDYGDKNDDGENDKQTVFFEITLPPYPVIPEIPYGTLAVVMTMFAVMVIYAKKDSLKYT